MRCAGAEANTVAFFLVTAVVLACTEPALSDEAQADHVEVQSGTSASPVVSAPADPAALASALLPAVSDPGRCPAELGEAPAGVSPHYAVALRVHVTRSDQSPLTLCGVLAEVNRIWWSQVGVCFDVEVVSHDEISDGQLDLWFERRAPFPNGVEANGVYVGAHEIYALDEPELARTRFAVTRPAARTAAHELGHALGLRHQDCGTACNELLMRSGTMGFSLTSDSPANVDEIAVVRDNLQAAEKGPFVRALAPGEGCLGAQLEGLTLGSSATGSSVAGSAVTGSLENVPR
jgi:hypothetical protein